MAGEPTSVSVHGEGSGPGGAGAVTWTWSKATVLSSPMLWEVSNSPMVTGPVMDTVVEPISVQLTPSEEIQDMKGCRTGTA